MSTRNPLSDKAVPQLAAPSNFQKFHKLNEPAHPYSETLSPSTGEGNKENLAQSQPSHEQSVIQCVLRVLGFSWTGKISQPIGFQVSQQIANDQVIVGNSRSTTMFAWSQSSQSNMKALEREISAALNVNALPFLHTEASFSNGFQLSKVSTSTNVTYSSVHIHIADARLGTDVEIVKMDGHRFIFACSVATGYVINCTRVATDASRASTSSSKSSLQLDVNVEPTVDAGASIAKMWLLDSSQEASKVAYSLTVSGFGGFDPNVHAEHCDSVEKAIAFSKKVEESFRKALPSITSRYVIINPYDEGGHLREYPKKITGSVQSRRLAFEQLSTPPVVAKQKGRNFSPCADHPLNPRNSSVQASHYATDKKLPPTNQAIPSDPKPVFDDYFGSSSEAGNEMPAGEVVSSFAGIDADHPQNSEIKLKSVSPSPPISVLSPPPAESTPTPTAAPKLEPSGARFCKALGDQLLHRISNVERKTLEKVSPARFLTYFLLTFPSTLQSFNMLRGRRLRPTDCIMAVVGPSGCGKSTLIGHSLGNNFVWTSDNQLEYSGAEFVTRPFIGHEPASATLGCTVFGGGPLHPNSNWLDAGGLSDSRGVEADLINAMSLALVLCGPPHKKWMSKDHCDAAAKSIIVVIDSASVSCMNERGKRFRDLIKKLGNGVKNITDTTVWKSILFVVNDKFIERDRQTNRPLSKKERLKRMKKEITRGREATDNAINDLIGDSSIADWFKSACMDQMKQKLKKLDKIRETDQAKAAKLEEFIKCRELLHLAETHFESNFIIADLDPQSPDHLKTTEDIISRAQSGQLKVQHLDLEHMYEGELSSSTLVFQTLMHVLVSYFNVRHKHLKAKLEMVRKLKEKISDLTQKIKNTQIKIENARPTDCYQLAKEITLEEKQREDGKSKEVEQLQVSLSECKAKVAKLLEDIRSHRTNMKEELLTELLPPKSVESRSFWSFIGTWYTFRYVQGIPIVRVERRGFPTKSNSTVAAGTYEEEETNNLSQGIFVAKYKPGHCGYDESKVRIAIYVATKDHPSTEARLRELETDHSSAVAKRDQEKLSLQRVRTELDVLRSNRKLAEANAKKIEEEQKAFETNKAKLEATVALLTKERESAEKDLQNVVLTLAEMQTELEDPSFIMEKRIRALILSTIQAFSLQTLPVSNVKDIFQAFWDEFEETSELYEDSSWESVPARVEQ